MAIEYQKKAAFFRDIVAVDEAETLLEWFQKSPEAEIDLSALSHIHTACLQVLMAVKPEVSAWPEDESLKKWLQSALRK